MAVLSLQELGDLLENLLSDSELTPSVKFRLALRDALVAEGILLDIAHKFTMRMTVQVSAFDAADPEWVRVINGYTQVVKRLYTIAGYEIVHLAKDFSIDI